MQDLAAFVAQRLPARAQHSVQTLAVTEPAHPAVVVQDQPDITATLAGLVRDVLGADVPLHQPFMAASLSNSFSCTGLLYAAAAQVSTAQTFQPPANSSNCLR